MVATDWAMDSCPSRNSCFSRNFCFLWTLFSHEKGENTTGLQLCRTGHPRNTQETLQVVSFLVFLPENHPWCVLHTHVHPHDIIAWKQCHLVVGHTLMYTLCKFEVNQTDGSWDIDIFVSSPLFLLIWPLSPPDHPICLRHGFRSNATTTHHPVWPGHCRHYCQCTDS